MSDRRDVITIGTFDGMHLGHAALLRRAGQVREAIGKGARVVAMCFDPHPATLLRPERAPERLASFERKAALLREAGADAVERLEPTRVLLDQDPEAFLAWLDQTHAPAALVEGADFKFGKDRRGDVAMLESWGRSRGIRVERVEPVVGVLSDHAEVVASSTLVRWLVRHGRVGDAARVLGRPYELEGTVVPGDRRGRTIGFPTANLQTDCLLPGDGVYAGRAVLPDGRSVLAAINIGPRPTFGAQARVAEAHLLGIGPTGCWAPIDGLDEYGWTIHLEMWAWLRDQVRFESVQGLTHQLERDCERVRQIMDEQACGDMIGAGL